MATRFLTDAELRLQHGEAAIHRRAVRDGSGVEADGVVEGAILRAESKATAILLGRFTDAQIPNEDDDRPASPWLKELVGKLALFNLEDHYDKRSDKVVEDAAIAVADLKRISAGQLSAVLEDSPAVDSSRAVVLVSKRSASLRDQPITLPAMDGWGHR